MGKDNRSSDSLVSQEVFTRICQDARPSPVRELSFPMLSSVSGFHIAKLPRPGDERREAWPVGDHGMIGED